MNFMAIGPYLGELEHEQRDKQTVLVNIFQILECVEINNFIPIECIPKITILKYFKIVFICVRSFKYIYSINI